MNFAGKKWNGLSIERFRAKGVSSVGGSPASGRAGRGARWSLLGAQLGDVDSFEQLSFVIFTDHYCSSRFKSQFLHNQHVP